MINRPHNKTHPLSDFPSQFRGHLFIFTAVSGMQMCRAYIFISFLIVIINIIITDFNTFYVLLFAVDWLDVFALVSDVCFSLSPYFVLPPP